MGQDYDLGSLTARLKSGQSHFLLDSHSGRLHRTCNAEEKSHGGSNPSSSSNLTKMKELTVQAGMSRVENLAYCIVWNQIFKLLEEEFAAQC